MRQFVRKLAVVRAEKQSLRIKVKSADRVKPLARSHDEIRHGFAPLFVGHSRDITGRLVEHDICKAAIFDISAYFSASDVNFVKLRVYFVAERSFNSVYKNIAFYDFIFSR